MRRLLLAASFAALAAFTVAPVAQAATLHTGKHQHVSSQKHSVASKKTKKHHSKKKTTAAAFIAATA